MSPLCHWGGAEFVDSGPEFAAEITVLINHHIIFMYMHEKHAKSGLLGVSRRASKYM